MHFALHSGYDTTRITNTNRITSIGPINQRGGKMKKGRSRNPQLRRKDRTPSVICLPPPKAPVTAPRKEPEAARAIPLQSNLEPLAVMEQVLADNPPSTPSRQVRRQELRARSKQVRPAASLTDMATNAPTSSDGTLAPLPRNRALTDGPQGRLKAVGQWLRSLVMTRRKLPVPVPPQQTVAQLRAMRADLARMQGTLDRMIERAPR